MTFPMPHVPSASSPLLIINNPGVAYSTDFGNHQNADDWSTFRSDDHASLSIVNSGIISSKCLQLEDANAAMSYMAYQWLLSDAVSTDDQEVLALIEFNGTKISQSGFVLQAAAALKCSSVFQVISAGIGRNSSADSQGRYSNASSQEGGQASFSWSVGSRYWVRLRIQSTRQLRRKIWAYGGSEPGSFTTNTPATSAWPTAAGRAGVFFFNTPVGGNMRVHYISVAYAGGTAPSP